MANNFFSKFPLIDYNIDGQGSFLSLTNFTKNVDVNDFFANHSAYYTFYDIVDGERPDTVSYNLYGNSDYHWTFFILNNELRNGLGSSWPLSSNQLDRMFEQQYDAYSAITLLPASDSNTGIDVSGLMQLTYLDAAYLPYLRLTTETGTEWAKLLKYDNNLLQAVVYDIERSDGSGTPSTLTPYLSSLYFKFVWVNPFDEVEEADEFASNELLKLKFVNSQIEVYAEFDSAAIVDASSLSELPSQAAIKAAIRVINENYVFSKRFLPAPSVYIWASYRNAAAEYYDEVDGVANSLSSFDVISNDAIITPKYISNHEKELLINAKKEKIRVLRPDRLVEFVNAYFTLLNG